MTHSAAMQDALDRVAAVANLEARLFQPVPTTVFGLPLEKVQRLIEFFEEQTGLPADQIGAHRHVVVVAPDQRSAVDAINAHGLHVHRGRVVIVTPGNPERGRGLSRELPWTVVSSPARDTRFWNLYSEQRGRMNNEPSDMRVAFLRAGSSDGRELWVRH